MKQVLIIGAGISGLAAAVILKKRGYAVTVIEASDTPGGVAKTHQDQGFLCELGPNTLLVSEPETISFLKEYGLWQEAWEANPWSKNRFVIKNKKLIPLPLNPIAFLATPLLSLRAKVKAIQGLFSVRSASPRDSVADFFSREFGEEILQKMVDPFVSGIWAGDPSQLNLRYALPKLYALKKENISLAKAFFKKKKKERHLISWPQGIGYFSEKLAESLGNSIYYKTRAETVSFQKNQFRVTTPQKSLASDFLIVATPLVSMLSLLKPLAPEISDLEQMPKASLAVVHLGFHLNAIRHPLNGFGMLINRKEGLRTLGALFSSSLFSQRASKNQILLTAFIGGIHDSNVLQLSDEALSETVLSDLKNLLGISQNPIYQKITRWFQAIPQYDKNYGKYLDLCQKVEAKIPGLHLLGNYRNGISLENVVLNARQLAQTLP